MRSKGKLYTTRKLLHYLSNELVQIMGQFAKEKQNFRTLNRTIIYAQLLQY